MTREEAIEILQEEHDWCQEPSYVIKAIEKALAALRPVSREQVEKVWRGEWIHDPDTGYEHCDKCGHTICLDDYLNRTPPLFCEMCGDAKTDEAVEMVLERLGMLYDC